MLSATAVPRAKIASMNIVERLVRSASLCSNARSRIVPSGSVNFRRNSALYMQAPF
jgi:hypothetical protein